MTSASGWIKASKSASNKQGEAGPILSFTSEWAAGLDGAKNGEFDHQS